jgi:dTDP-4-dehydrorhamnose 3,5-epimerase
MIKIDLKISGAFKGKIDYYFDKRGFFCDLSTKKFKDLNKINFYNNCISSSKKNVIRGLHYQTKNLQGHFIHVIKGKILDVGIDLRLKSKSFKKITCNILGFKTFNTLYLPPGVAHGFIALSEENLIFYSLSNNYDKKYEKIIRFEKSLFPKKYRKFFEKKLIFSKRDIKNCINFSDMTRKDFIL